MKINRTAKKRPELKEPVPPADGGMVTNFRCKECEFTRIKPFFTKIGPDTSMTTTRRQTIRRMMQEIRMMMEMMLSRMALTRRTTYTRRKPPNHRSATYQREQSPQLLRQCAAEGTLRGIQGHRRQRSQKVKQHVRKSQSQSSSCALLTVSAYVTKSYLSM